MLQIKQLTVKIENSLILDNLDLSFEQGKTDVIMGPNGSGKSTLAEVIVGKKYETTGQILFENQDILALSPETRSQMGIFLSFQNPIEIPGVNLTSFLKQIVDNKRAFLGLAKLSSQSFLKEMKSYLQTLKLPKEFLNRNLNEGMSGGEKKKCEILQMLMLKPKIAILDEIDSGLDIDSLEIISQHIRDFRSSENTVIIITHYQRLLKNLSVDNVHILSKGKIQISGQRELIEKIEKEGYTQYTKL